MRTSRHSVRVPLTAAALLCLSLIGTAPGAVFSGALAQSQDGPPTTCLQRLADPVSQDDCLSCPVYIPAERCPVPA